MRFASVEIICKKKTPGLHEDQTPAAAASVAGGALGPNISARGPKAPVACERRCVSLFLNILFLVILSSDEISLNLQVFLGARRPSVPNEALPLFYD